MVNWNRKKKERRVKQDRKAMQSKNNAMQVVVVVVVHDVQVKFGVKQIHRSNEVARHMPDTLGNTWTG